jgi:hypothetical protein
MYNLLEIVLCISQRQNLGGGGGCIAPRIFYVRNYGGESSASSPNRLARKEEGPVSITYEGGWATDLVRTQWQSKEYLPLPGIKKL